MTKIVTSNAIALLNHSPPKAIKTKGASSTHKDLDHEYLLFGPCKYSQKMDNVDTVLDVGDKPIHDQINERSIRNQGRSVICYESFVPFTPLNEHSPGKSLKAMRPWIYIILTPLLGTLGCHWPASPVSVPQPSVEGVTLQDLKSADIKRAEPVVIFLVTQYHLLPEQTPTAWTCSDGVPKKTLTFSDAESFTANGFAAFMGHNIHLGSLLSCLEQVGATRFGQASLLINPDTEMFFSHVFVAGHLAVRDGMDSINLRNGTLGWKLKAHLEPPSLRTVTAEIEPVFVPHQIAAWPGAEQYTEQRSHRFQSGRMTASFREGDFIVLTARHDNEKDMQDIESLLFFQQGTRPRTLLYVVVFARVEQ